MENKVVMEQLNIRDTRNEIKLNLSFVNFRNIELMVILAKILVKKKANIIKFNLTQCEKITSFTLNSFKL